MTSARKKETARVNGKRHVAKFKAGANAIADALAGKFGEKPSPEGSKPEALAIIRQGSETTHINQ